MAYQEPILYLLHAAADAGAAAITPSAAFEAAAPVDYLIDGRPSRLARFAASGSGRFITVDRGAGGGLEAVDTVVIPAGHNLDPASQLTILHSTDNVSYPTIGTLNPVPSGQLVIPTTSSTNRYLRILVSGVGQWELGELYFTRARQPTRGPDPNWAEAPRQPVEVVEFPTRLSTARVAVDQRTYTYTFRRLAQGGADLAILDAAIASGRDAPFYLRQTDTAVSELVLVKVAGTPRREQAREVEPRQGAAFDVTVTLQEQTA